MYSVLPQTFYQRHALYVARDLLGQILVRRLADGRILSGRIVETEAYTPDDPSCHAHRGTTPRAQSMFKVGGITYVYLIYGMYYCLNVVAQQAGEGAAVLVRAIEPLTGVQSMAQARQKTNLRDLARGPGRLCQALSIDRTLDGSAVDDLKQPIHLLSHATVPDEQVRQTPRIGINATPAAMAAPWRFIIADNRFVSGTTRQNEGTAYEPTPDWFRP